MRNSNRSMKVSTLAFGIVAALTCTQAMASGFQIREDSIQAMSRSHAGSASAPGDVAVVANNPAAMSLFDKATIQSDLTAIDLSGKFTGGGHDALGAPLSGGNGGDAGDIAPVPAFHLIVPFGNGFSIGASVTAPFGLKTQYDANWVGRYQALKSDVRTVDFTLAGAYKFNDSFSLGLSLITQRLDAELTNAVDFGAILTPAAYPAFQPQSADGSASIKGNDTAFGWDVGLLFTPGSNTNIGLNYRSKINHGLSGKARFNVPSNVQFVLGLNPATASLFTDTPVTASVSTPSVLTLSITQKLSDTFSLSGDIERTNWSSLQNLTVDFANPAQPNSVEQFNWSDSMEYALGMDWKFAPQWVLRAGFAYDETPTNNTFRDPRLPDNNRQLYSIGLGWTPSDNVSWNIGYSHIAIDTPTVNDVSATGSTLVGKYSADANLFGISGTFTF
jgi:long-chain fatty acid transport protein